MLLLIGELPLGRIERAFRLVGARRVHIDIDVLDARLSLAMARTGEPFAAPELDIGHLGEPKAFPLAFRREPAAGAAGELIGQRTFPPVGVTQYGRAERTRMALIEAEHLLAIGHGAGDEVVGLADQSCLRRVVA
jgi:hypothetical protein